MKFRSILIVLCAVFLAGAAVAAPQLDTVVLGHGIAFSTDFSYDTAFIRVTGPDGYLEDFAIEGGDALAVAFDRALADGRYSWQLLVVEPIDEGTLTAMREARRLGEKNLTHRFDVESHTFTGTFLVEGGAVTTPTRFSQGDRDIATKDNVIADDLIVQFSACIGNDCVNGESFGFDTLRLKENNLRIHFNDTSNSASFPSTDWRLVANDTNNGGSNHFSIEDSTTGRSPFRVEGGAPPHSLVVEADGDMGVGTVNPVVEMHVVDGDSPTLRLEQDGSSGFTPQTFDIVSNEANFFVRDVTNGSQLPLRIKPGADSNSLFIAADNSIGISTDAPQTLLHVRDGGSAFNPSNSAVNTVFQNNAGSGDGSIIALIAGDSGNAQIFFGDSVSENQGRFIYRNATDAMSLFTNGVEAVRIDSDGDVCFGCNLADVPADFQLGQAGSGPVSKINAGEAQFDITSSREMKENIVPVEASDVLAKIAGIEVYTYDFIDGPTDKLGLIAEDFHQVFGRGSDKSINGQEVQMALWLAVQELSAQNKALAERLEQLEGQGVE